MRAIILISRIFTGLVFIFSGFVKAVDPVGFAIKFEEYFIAFHLDFLVFAALPLAIIICAAELMIGLNLLTGLRMKVTAWLLLIFMSFFTLLTFVLALTNPVSDCGCFGDAVKLTNWQTFWKNIVLFVPSLAIFLYRKKFPPFSRCTFEWMMSGMNFLIAVLISWYGIRHEPLLDFRPYASGTNIPEKMIIPEGAPADVFETILVYEKNGISQEFTESNFPWQDTTWKWVETKQNLISKGYEPPIHDFTITDEAGNDITDLVLTNDGYVFLIIAPFLEKASDKGMHRMNDLALRAKDLGFQAYCLTSSTNDRIMQFKSSFQPAFNVCTADETTLKTIIRANPGLLVLLKGTILAKWNHTDVPDAGEIKADMLSFLLDNQRLSGERTVVIILLLAVALLYACIVFIKPK
ncbi:MAG: DoxX family protein [Bacteroidales bacterium]|nr:DoxX family protein [Bacteroidales bacterium]